MPVDYMDFDIFFESEYSAFNFFYPFILKEHTPKVTVTAKWQMQEIVGPQWHHAHHTQKYF